MLKVSDACKRAIDNYFKTLDNIEDMSGLTRAQKTEMMTDVSKEITTTSGWRNKLAEFVINSYVSALATPLVNVLSALVKAPLLVAERALVGLMPGNTVKFNESFPMMKGFFEGMAEGINFAKAGWIEGMPLDTNIKQTDVMAGWGKGTAPAEDASAFEKGVFKAERKVAPVITAPTRAGVFVDEFAKAVFRRMQLNALAYRVSREVPENKLMGKTRDQIYEELRSAKITDPTKIGNSRQWKETLRGFSPYYGQDIAQELTDFALVNTFQAQLGDLGNMLLRARQRTPELVFIAPFIKTPINIFKDALSYTPASFFMRQFKNRRAEAAARTMLGAGLGTMTAYMIMQDKITGSYPKDPGRRAAMVAAGTPEYSVKIGDQWYSYSRIEPLASVLGVFADSFNSMVDYYAKPDAERKVQELAVDGVLAITKNLTSKTFLEGITGILQAAHDPERYGGQFVNSFAGILVPGAVAQFARGTDPVLRDVQDFGDALENRIPGLRQTLPVKKDILGKDRVNPSYGLGAIGIASFDAEQTALQQELKDVRFSYPEPSRKIGGVELNTTDYEKYAELSGRLVEESLLKLTNTPGYNNYNNKQKQIVLKKIAERSRAVATKIMLSEKFKTDPEFREEYQRVLRSKKGIE